MGLCCVVVMWWSLSVEVRGERCEVRMEGVGEGWEWEESNMK